MKDENYLCPICGSIKEDEHFEEEDENFNDDDDDIILLGDDENPFIPILTGIEKLADDYFKEHPENQIKGWSKVKDQGLREREIL